ncbi:conserved Plasmodium protein, unknown function [Plasmodium gallinaceum]|uniref:Uncharacterized protein n=1 Tax=Plasmodium gallinaceum TaxID=5849 RepID=A0A1J1GYA6_PLAGA|nr:conserved Plasmodium protein, unknown function [Plasmodium gallinaceum]CRG97445.1 conserved Plasmodium protein, unknown function [Plasmodium gallinaceum]
MPHHLTSFVAALTGSISSGTCCGCIPFTFYPSVTPAVASSTAPLSAALPNTVIPTAVASQSAVSSTPVLTSVMAFFTPLLSFYKKCNVFGESLENNKLKVDKKCQCNLIIANGQICYDITNEMDKIYQIERENLENNTINENTLNENEVINESNVNINGEIFKQEIISIDNERSLTSSEYSMHSFLEEKEIENYKNEDSN